jgi:hypothetical protein
MTTGCRTCGRPVLIVVDETEFDEGNAGTTGERIVWSRCVNANCPTNDVSVASSEAPVNLEASGVDQCGGKLQGRAAPDGTR